MSAFATAYPAPWRIVACEVLDRASLVIADFDPADEDGALMWRGIVACVNAVADIAGDPWVEGVICHSDAGGTVGEPAALDLVRRLERVRNVYGSFTDPVVAAIADALEGRR